MVVKRVVAVVVLLALGVLSLPLVAYFLDGEGAENWILPVQLVLMAVVGAVVGEYLGSAAGLGYLIQQAEGVFDVAGVFAGMFVLAAFVLVIDYLVTLVERRLLVWRPVAAETRT